MTMSATYCPEDNKLRLYATSRLDAETYARVKAAGFKWAPKQELFVAPGWTPGREDLLLELCEEIGDEDYSPEERAADRAERFSDYRDKRREEAGGHADTFEAGPSAFGHQNRARAERQAMRHDSHRSRAVSQWSKAEYWQDRTAGVIRHARCKSSASVRRGRILRLEAEQRKHEKTCEEYAARFAAWQKVLTLDGCDSGIVPTSEPNAIGIDCDKTSQAAKLAYTLANAGSCWGEYQHPRTERKTSLYSLMADSADPITAREAATLWLDGRTDPSDPDSYIARWSDHYTLRLTYEKAMLAEEGGTAAEADIEAGGWICGIRTYGVFEHLERGGWHQVQAVCKSPATGRVTSVRVFGRIGCNETKPGLVNCNIERLPEGSYRAPTDEEREAFKVATKERKAAAKASKPAAPQLINPTDEDAERLQAIWNTKGAERYAGMVKRDGFDYHGGYKPTKVKRMTQAEYSASSGGSYSRYETVAVCDNGHQPPARWEDKPSGPIAFKIRKTYGGGNFTGQAHTVIVITDKPQKPLPLDWEKVLDTATEAVAH